MLFFDRSKETLMARRKFSRNEKINNIVSLLVIFSMVFGTFASLIATPF